MNITRKGKLKKNIEGELKKTVPNINIILEFVDDYEKSNLDTIDNLRRDKLITIKKINGALKQTINAHGVITKLLIGSASKRIYGMLLENKKESFLRKVLKFFA